MITTKNKKTFGYVLLFSILGCLLFSFEFFQNFSNEYKSIETVFYNKKKNNSKALKEIKSFAKGSIAYSKYLKVNKEYKEASQDLKHIKKKESVMGFDNIRLFAYEFFPLIALFIYVIFNLKKSFKLERKSIGTKIIHGVILIYCFFKLFWIFQKYEDFSKPVYYLMTVFSAYFVGLAVYIVHKQQVRKTDKLKKQVLSISYKAIVNSREDKKEEMINAVKEAAKL